MTRFARKEGLRLGFSKVGVCPADPPERARFFSRWLGAGYAGTMQWLERDPERRADPRIYFEGARSVVSALMEYDRGEEPSRDPGRAAISRYAWGDDYHQVLSGRLSQLAAALSDRFAGVRARAAVDTSALLEKLLAGRSGIGWQGKHTNLVNPELGSWFFLGEVVLDAEMEYDEPMADLCGTCRACIDVCPTGAIVAPYVLDARLCISYLTIEHRGPIPRDLRPLMGNRVFGCDDCQEVCPWNRFARPSPEKAFAPREVNRDADLGELIGLDQEGFARRFRGSPIRRARRDGLLRNVAVALGNSGQPRAVAPLARALSSDPSWLVRAHAAWGLGRIGGEEARRALETARRCEENEEVRAEIDLALVDLDGCRGCGEVLGSQLSVTEN